MWYVHVNVYVFVYVHVHLYVYLPHAHLHSRDLFKALEFLVGTVKPSSRSEQPWESVPRIHPGALASWLAVSTPGLWGKRCGLTVERPWEWLCGAGGRGGTASLCWGQEPFCKQGSGDRGINHRQWVTPLQLLLSAGLASLLTSARSGESGVQSRAAECVPGRPFQSSGFRGCEATHRCPMSTRGFC